MTVVLLGEGTRRARRVYQCEVCTTTIAVGETHNARVCVDVGRAYAYTLRTCLRCDALLMDVWEWSGGPDDGVDSEDYREWAAENADDPRAVAYLARREGWGQ